MHADKTQKLNFDGSIDLSTCPPSVGDRSDSLDLGLALRRGSELKALDLKVEWVVDGLIPERSITLLPGAGGIGKTYLSLALANAVSKGTSFMGLSAKQTPVVYVDFENSLPVLVERIKKLDCEDVLFWHQTNKLMPPRLDEQLWWQYRQLPAGSLLIFDTLRASQGSDENVSRDMAHVMQRFKALRDDGYSIILLHHTPKADDKKFKGSTAILDLADHELTLCKTGKESAAGPIYRLGTDKKTRYMPCELFMNFDPDRGFVPTFDPDINIMKNIGDLLQGQPALNQSQVFDLIREHLKINSKAQALALLKKGEGTYWTAEKDGKSRKYTLIQPDTNSQELSTCPTYIQVGQEDRCEVPCHE